MGRSRHLSLTSMRKVDDGEEKKKEKRKEKENNDVYSGHYVIASRPPERRPTGTPHARANTYMSLFFAKALLQLPANCSLIFAQLVLDSW